MIQDHPSRRGIIAAGAASAAFSMLQPRQVRGDDANARVRIGIVGCGQRGSLLAGFFQKHGGYQFVGVADYFPEVADKAGETLGVEKSMRFSGLKGYRRLIDSGKLEAIVLETPPYCFPEHVAAAVEAGLHVYMAKPVACDVPGTLSVLASAKKAQAGKKVFLIDFQTRTDPHFIECIKRIHGGALDTIGLLSSWYTDEGFSDPPLTDTIESRMQRLIWCNDDAIGAGYFVNAGIHAIDVALWVANQLPIAAMGLGRRRRKDPHGDSNDSFSLSYEFPGGLILNHRGEHLHNLWGFSCGVHAYGREAFFEGQYNGKTWLRGGEKAYRGGEVQNLYGDGAKRNIDTFCKSIRAGDYSNPTVTPSINSNLAVILGREAARINGRLTWDEVIKQNRSLAVSYKGCKE